MNLSQKLIDEAMQYVTNLLTHHLSEKIYYHNLQHTKTVVKGVKIIASHVKLPREQSFVLQLAAWFHDIGFLGNEKEHEILGAKIAGNYLKTKNIAPEIIDEVCNCIMATELGAKPESVIENIIKDADMFHLREDNYWELNGKLREEITATYGKHFDHYEWYQKNLEFLGNISFHTEYGKTVLNNRRNWLIIENEKLLNTIKNGNPKQFRSPGLFSSKGYRNSIKLSNGYIVNI